MMKERHTLILACVASVLLSALAVTAASLLLEGGIPPLGSPKWQPLSGRLNLSFIGALVHSVIFGIPAFLWVRHRHRITLLRCVLWGFAIGALPLGILSLLSQFGLESASTNNIPTVVRHVPTLFGLLELAEFVGLLGAMGFIGGFGFWIGLWATGALPAVNRVSIKSPFGMIRMVAILLLSFAGASAVMHFIPAAAVDRSCHNMFRDGRREITPVVNINLNVSQLQWGDVREFFRRFSVAHNLSFQDGEEISGVGLPDALMLDLCNAQGTNISVTMYHQMGDANSAVSALPIGIYLFRPNLGWKSLTRDFIESMQQLWPGKVEFRDGGGRIVPKPKILDQK